LLAAQRDDDAAEDFGIDRRVNVHVTASASTQLLTDRGKLIVVPGWPYKMFVSLFTRLPHAWRMSLQSRSPHTKDRLSNA